MHLLGILRLTFRELWARKITLGLFIVASVIWLLMAFALNLDIVDGSLAGLRIFGQGEADLTQTRRDAETGEVVREMLGLKEFVVVIESFVAGATYWGALLLGLFATASLLPGLLESGRAAVLLAKPVSRPRLLAGHVLGMVLVVLALATYLMG
ncbi:MAG: hypothetical protein R3362_09600, partial [Rhodothermales bacterium]|nr:hypothetical protein [Rhodothermales bacterium]